MKGWGKEIDHLRSKLFLHHSFRLAVSVCTLSVSKMAIYTTEEKVHIVKWFYISSSVEEVIGRFVFTFQDRPVPCATTVRNIVHKFEQTGCIAACRNCDNKEGAEKVIPDKEINICAAVETSEPCSSRNIAEQVGCNARTVRRVLKKHGYKSYKISTTQEIFPADCNRRLEFCEAVRERADRNNLFLENILFSDESSFPLHGYHNPSIVRYWSRENKHLSMALRTQYPQKVNVWAGMLQNHIIGPFFIDGMLTAAKYLDMLQNQIVPAVRNLPINFEEVWFQQDGCPAHNARNVNLFLQTTFPNRLISTQGTINWPPRSPDLSPNDFFLWGYVKNSIYGHNHERPMNIDELRLKIVQSLENIPAVMLAKVRSEFYNRLGYCEAQQGGIFEPLI